MTQSMKVLVKPDDKSSVPGLQMVDCIKLSCDLHTIHRMCATHGTVKKLVNKTNSLVG